MLINRLLQNALKKTKLQEKWLSDLRKGSQTHLPHCREIP